MKNVLITGLLSITFFLVGLGFEVSGFENIYIAYILWGLAFILAIITLCLLISPKAKLWKRKIEVEEIEVPKDIADKILEVPKGKVIRLEGKKVKRKIDKNGE